MVRLAPVVAPGIPHHITQRGNRRPETFFCAVDYERSGRPRGSEAFTGAVEKQLRRTLRRGTPGPKVTGNS